MRGVQEFRCKALGKVPRTYGSGTEAALLFCG